MESGKQKTILIQLTHGMQARNFLYTSIFKKMTEAGVQLILVVPEYKIPYYRETIDMTNVTLVPIPKKNETRIIQRIKNISFNLLYTPTVKWWRDQRWEGKPKTFKYYAEVLLWYFGALSSARRFARFVFSRVVDTSSFDVLFDHTEIDLVVVPDVYSIPDVFLFYAAKRHRIPTVCMVRSWDNVTSKGTCLIKPEKLIVHNERVRDEAVKYIGTPKDHIQVTGLPHFDYYVSYEPTLPRAEFLRKLGMPENARFILFADATGSFRPITSELLEILDTEIKNGALPRDVYILFRYAPHKKKGENIFSSDRIIFDQPGKHFKQDGLNDWEFSKEDMHYMADCLTYASVMLNYASTMTIDSAAMDCPVINVSFDGHTERNSSHSLSRIYTVQHFRHVLATGGTPLVKSREELIGAINAYLDDRSLDRAGRARIVKDQCTIQDGHAGDRVASRILAEVGLS